MSALDGWVYRDGARTVSGAAALRDLRARAARLDGLAGEPRRRAAVEAVVAAGMVEAALDDRGHPSARVVARLVDDLATNALGRMHSLSCIDAACAPETIELRTPEGFAYYALHPEAYARATDGGARDVLVVGIRSIGATLAAIACAAWRARGVRAERITVRPTGAPYDRRLDLDDDARAVVRRARDASARVFVVDEGPGLSGSTLLATGEAIARAGVPHARIALVCSHEPDVARLVAPDAAARWRAFRTIVARSDARAPRDAEDLSGGAWRARRLRGERAWPWVFAQAERRKLLAGGRVFKFEGLGPSGEAVRARADALARAGWAPPARDEGDGWVSYPWIDGDAAERPPIETVAAYCAARPELCPIDAPPADLRPMVDKNLAALGCDAARAHVDDLAIVRPAVVDARMAPHEWASATKLDAAADGDGHFFPGPTDVAWDLAAVVVEWELDDASRAALLDAYARASGDDARARIDAWIVAYAAFEGALAALARRSTGDAAEAARLDRAAARYRGVVAISGRCAPPRAR